MAADKCDKIEMTDTNSVHKTVPENAKRTFKESYIDLKKNITVEPLLVGVVIPVIIAGFAMRNLNLDKACRVYYNYSAEICDVLVKQTADSNYSSYEKEVQKLIASIDIWRSVIDTALPCIIVIFLGAWSDRTGKRKICIILPIFAQILTCISYLINVYFFYEIPVHVTMFFETIFPAITGGWVTMYLGVFSYISDITTEETRTFRVGVVNFCMTVGYLIAMAVSGILQQVIGYYAIFSITLAMMLIMTAYGVFYLKESGDLLIQYGLPPIERTNNTKESFFDVSHVLETVRVAYKKRPSNRRLKIILTLFTVLIIYGPVVSENSVFYLFVRNNLNWDMVKFGLYSSVYTILYSIGAMFAITILSKRLQIDDSLLCLISLVSKFFGSVWTAFVRTDLEMYLVAVVEILTGATFTSLRSIITKLVEKQETAKMMSLLNLTETVAALLFNPFYSWMYMRTLDVLPGAVFLVTAAFIIPASVILITFYVQHKREVKNAAKKPLEAEEKQGVDCKIKSITMYPPELLCIDNMGFNNLDQNNHLTNSKIPVDSDKKET